MRTSVFSEGAVNSPGRNCMKSFKTAAVFQTSSSILPSMTGGLSKRVSFTGLTLSAVRRTARRASADAGNEAKMFEVSPDAGVVLVVEAAPLAGAFVGAALAGVAVSAAGG